MTEMKYGLHAMMLYPDNDTPPEKGVRLECEIQERIALLAVPHGLLFF